MSQEHAQREFSIELFPPRGARAEARLDRALEKMAPLKASYFSVTFGAGGTTQSGTLATALRAREITGQPVAPHLSCIESTCESISDLLDRYQAADIDRIVALRGDLLEGMTTPGEFAHANELVEFIKNRHGDAFRLEVAAYPEYHPMALSPAEDIDNFARKVRAGADSALTQYFYNADAYFHFRDQAAARGIDIPIVPGIMPILDFAQVTRFSALCGADIPRWVRLKMESYADDRDAMQAFGHELVMRMCERLLDGGAPGLHFYALNKAKPTIRLWRDLNLPCSSDSCCVA